MGLDKRERPRIVGSVEGSVPLFNEIIREITAFFCPASQNSRFFRTERLRRRAADAPGGKKTAVSRHQPWLRRRLFVLLELAEAVLSTRGASGRQCVHTGSCLPSEGEIHESHRV